MRKIQRNVQNYEECAEFREIWKIQRNVQNSEKHSKYLRNVQDTENIR